MKLRKSFMSLFLVIALLAALFAVPVSADDNRKVTNTIDLGDGIIATTYRSPVLPEVLPAKPFPRLPLSSSPANISRLFSQTMPVGVLCFRLITTKRMSASDMR